MKEPARLLPIAGDGWKFVGGFALVGVVFLVFGPVLGRTVGGLFVLAALFSLYFFRDGKRGVPATSDLVSPADGRVLEVADVEGEGYGSGRVVRIFLSVFDGHVQRAPVAGTVVGTLYQPGAFLNAANSQAAFLNERNSVELQAPQGRVMVRQIAGLIARRILCWVRPQDRLELGQRIGLIRFGSQVDLYFPRETEVLVRVGQRVRAGETPVARWLGGASALGKAS